MPLKPILPDASIFFRTLSYQIEEVFEPPQRRPFPFFSKRRRSLGMAILNIGLGLFFSFSILF
jgi:hypothetical protein